MLFGQQPDVAILEEMFKNERRCMLWSHSVTQSYLYLERLDGFYATYALLEPLFCDTWQDCAIAMAIINLPKIFSSGDAFQEYDCVG